MRALTRTRRLAAALALLLFISANALAGVPGRPIERPEGPPEPNPQEVGDPDTPPSLVSVVIGRYVFVLRLPSWIRSFANGASLPRHGFSGNRQGLGRGHHAR
jgi:hypothetical protein